MNDIFELLVVLVVIAFLAMPVVLLVLTVLALRSNRRLRRTVEGLDQRLLQLEARLGQPGAGAEAPPPTPRAETAPAATEGSSISEPAVDRAPSSPPPVVAPAPASQVPRRPLPGQGPAGRSPAPPAPPPPSAAAPVTRPPAPPFGPPGGASSSPGLRARIPWPDISLEELLGTRLLAWVGAMAVVLAVVFLVRDAFGGLWNDPRFRVGVGIAVGAVLLAVGEWLRRRSRWVAGGVTAAGIGALLVAFWAATSLYQLLGPAAGFACLGVTSVFAVLLALRQGPVVAVLGLLGGLATPALVESSDPRPGALFGYLLLLTVGILVVGTRRGWWWLPAASTLGGLAWVLIWLAGPFEAGPGSHDGAWLGVFLVALAGSVVAATLRAGEVAQGEAGSGAPGSGERRLAALWRQGVLWLGGVGPLLTLGSVVLRGGGGAFEWAFLGLLVAALMVLARLRPALFGLAGAAVAAFAVTLLGRTPDLSADELGRFLVVTGAFGVLCGGGSVAFSFRSPGRARWAALGGAAGLAAVLLGWWGDRAAAGAGEALGLSWGLVALGVALAYLVAAVLAVRLGSRPGEAADGERGDGRRVLAVLAATVTALVALAIPLELEQEWWTVAWALQVLALVVLARRLGVAELERLAGLLALGVVVRLALNPAVFGYPVGPHPVLNLLTWSYGTSAAALVGASALARPGRLRRLLEAASVAVLVAWGLIAVRQLYHPGRLEAVGLVEGFGLAEAGMLTCVWLTLALALSWTGERFERPVPTWGGTGVALLALGGALLLQGLTVNPLWANEPVGARWISGPLALAYALPAVLLALLAIGPFGRSPRGRTGERATGVYRAVLWIGSAASAFLFVNLTVRQAFRGSDLSAGTLSLAESYAYSATWGLFGSALLVVGILRGRDRRTGRAWRFTGFAFITLAAAKVFLWDTRGLDGLYRVLSFAGLGVTLLALAYLYQRFVDFSGGGESEGPGDSGPPAASPLP